MTAARHNQRPCGKTKATTLRRVDIAGKQPLVTARKQPAPCHGRLFD
jgi:hypothetical protein